MKHPSISGAAPWFFKSPNSLLLNFVWRLFFLAPQQQFARKATAEAAPGSVATSAMQARERKGLWTRIFLVCIFQQIVCCHQHTVRSLRIRMEITITK